MSTSPLTRRLVPALLVAVCLGAAGPEVAHAASATPERAPHRTHHVHSSAVATAAVAFSRRDDADAPTPATV